MSDQVGNSSQPPPGRPPSIFQPLELQRQSNRAAVVGLVLAVLFWPIGLIVSILAFFLARRRGGAGEAKAISGLLISVLLAIATFLYFFAFNAPPADPACAAADSAVGNLGMIVVGDQDRLTRDVDDPAAEQADIAGYLRDMKVAKVNLDAALLQATTPSVSNALESADGYLAQLISGLRNARTGGGTSQLPGISKNLMLEQVSIDQVCPDGS